MVSIKSLLSAVAIAGVAVAAPQFGNGSTAQGCDQLNIIMTGLPAYHPLVIAQGVDPAMVQEQLKADSAALVAAGYNLKLVVLGPEQNVSALSDQMEGTRWDGVIIGYGVRGSNRSDLTLWLADLIDMFRVKAPTAPFVFNRSSNTSLWAVEERLPLSSNCTDQPGTDLGFVQICDICSQ